MVSRIRYHSLLVMSLLVLTACDSKDQGAKPAAGPVEVGIVEVIRGDMPLEAELP